MLRRLIVLSAIAWGVIALTRAREARVTRAADAAAHADWESEGGAPRPDELASTA